MYKISTNLEFNQFKRNIFENISIYFDYFLNFGHILFNIYQSKIIKIKIMNLNLISFLFILFFGF